MSIREKRLRGELDRMELLKEESTLFDFKTQGSPPEQYLICFMCKGLAEPDIISEEHIVGVYLHAEYPIKPPIVRWLTPIYHPNILIPNRMTFKHPETGEAMSMDEMRGLMEEAEVEIPEYMQHSNEGRVCLDTLDLNWAPSVTLDRLCIELAEMIQYKKYNLGDPLDQDAAEWAGKNKNLFPIDNRDFVDLRIRFFDEEEEISINFMD